MKRPLLVLALLVGMFAAARLLVPASAATYTQVNSPASANWNTAPWDTGEPTYANALVGLLRGGGTMEINTDEGGGGLLVGWLGTYTVNMTDGSLTLGSADNDNWLFLSENGTGRGTFNQTGGTVRTPGVIFNRSGGADLGHYSLGGTGVLNTGAVARAQGTATFDFNGGTLQASVHNGNWVDSGITINVQAGGAVIDTQAFDVTVNSALLDGGGGGGLVKYGPGVLRLNGSNTYTGTTTLDQGYLVLHQSSTYDGLMLFGTAGAYRRLDLWDGNTQTFRGLNSPANANTDIYNDPGSAMASLILDVPTGESYTYGGTLGIHGNPFSLTKRGPGTQVLAGSVNHIGGTTVEAGTLQIGSGVGAAPLGSGSYSVAGPATLVFDGNADNNFFTTQSISGDGDVVFRGQQNGYFTFRQGQYTGTLSYTGRTIVDLNDAPGNAWYQGTLWMEKDDLLPHGTILELQSGKVFLRNSESSGQTVAGLVGNAGTFITTDQGTIQKLNVDVAASQSYTFAGVIGSGEGNNNLSFTKTGPGTQIFTGNSLYTGGTTINDGTLQLGDGTVHGWVIGTINLANGADLAYYRTSGAVFSGGTGLADVTGIGNLTLQGARDSYYTLQQPWHYTGTTTVDLADGGWATLFVESTGSLPTTTDVNLTAGYVNLRNSQSWKGLAGSAGTAVTWDGGGTGTLTLDVDNGLTFSYAGAIRNTFGVLGLVKSGPGTQILAGDVTYTGSTSVTGGTLQIGAGAGNSIGGGPITLANDAELIFNRNADNIILNAISGDGNVTFLGASNGYYTLRSSPALTYTGSTTVNLDPGGTWYQGTLWVEGTGSLPNATVVDLQSGKIYIRQRDVTGETIGGLQGGAGTYITTDHPTIQKLNLDVATGESYTYAGAIGADGVQGNNNLALTKSGPGTQILTGDSNHTGGTTVAGGTLLVDGSVAGNVLVTGGLLGGDGGIGGNVDVQAGGAVSAGGSPGHLAVGGIYTQSGTMLAELGGLDQGINYDWIEVDGTATLGGLIDVDFYDGFEPSLGDTFDILTAAGGITNADLGGVTFDFSDAIGGPRLAASIVTLAGGGGEALRLAAVPEPSTLLLLVIGGLGLAGLALRRRRR